MRHDLTVMQARLTAIMESVAALVPPDPAPFSCEHCYATFTSRVHFQEHGYRHHDGEVPDHYLAAERAAGLIEP